MLKMLMFVVASLALLALPVSAKGAKRHCMKDGAEVSDAHSKKECKAKGGKWVKAAKAEGEHKDAKAAEHKEGEHKEGEHKEGEHKEGEHKEAAAEHKEAAAEHKEAAPAEKPAEEHKEAAPAEEKPAEKPAE